MRSLLKAMVMALGFMAFVLYATPAVACETDEDCGPGYVCETYEVTAPGCMNDKPDCDPDDPACLEEIEEGDICDTETTTYTDSRCRRAACEVDADCGEDMVCIEYVEEWCSGSGAADCDDEECEIIEEEVECGSDIYRECGYPFEAPCEQDADCGEGFDCVPMEVCHCNAGRDDSPDIDDNGVDGGDAPDVIPEDDEFEEGCSCEPTGESYCELQEIECTEDADCPPLMSCNPGYSVSECIAYDEGEVECHEIVSPAMCRPDVWDEDGDRINDNGSSDTDGTDIIGGDDPEDDEGDGDWLDHDDDFFHWCGCAVSIPAANTSSRFGLMGMLSLLTL